MNKRTVKRTSRLRRSFPAWCAAFTACFVLFGCAAPGASSDALAHRPLLTPWQALSGARVSVSPTLAFGAVAKAGPAAYLPFLSPTAVVARSGILYVFDSGHHQLFRYDPAQLAMARFTEHIGGSVAGIAVAPDLSLYVVDTSARQVLHFSWDGKPLPGFSHDGALVRPVAVVADEATGQVLVADSLYNHVVVFNSFGRALATLKSLEARSLESMARGPDGLYLVDRLSRQVVVMGLDGRDRYTLGGGSLKDPQAIAVDRFNRVFVSDGFDNTIKVYDGGQLAASFGGSGAMPALFNRITFLSIDQNTLYVADSLNARIQTFHIAPPGGKGRPSE